MCVHERAMHECERACVYASVCVCVRVCVHVCASGGVRALPPEPPPYWISHTRLLGVQMLCIVLLLPETLSGGRLATLRCC